MKFNFLILFLFFFSTALISMNNNLQVELLNNKNCKNIKKNLAEYNVSQNLMTILKQDESFACNGCEFHPYSWLLYFIYGGYIGAIKYCLQKKCMTEDGAFNFLVVTHLKGNSDKKEYKEIGGLMQKALGKERFSEIYTNAKSYYSLLGAHKYEKFNKNLFNSASRPLLVETLGNKGALSQFIPFAEYVLSRKKMLLAVIGNEVANCFDFLNPSLIDATGLFELFELLIPIRFNELMLVKNNEIRLDIKETEIQECIEKDYFLSHMVQFIKEQTSKKYDYHAVIIHPDDIIERFKGKLFDEIPLWKSFMQEFTPQLFDLVKEAAKNYCDHFKKDRNRGQLYLEKNVDLYRNSELGEFDHRFEYEKTLSFCLQYDIYTKFTA